ncbi:hypothetical protein INT47_002369 [Mucor saturninus]|uniref:BZIP domain-containing protein n=1 Tax=Mucor saturninus TaxID=64648 RepID=A0A8H7UXG8_9FUNG|nr:hypothetical protein INT47_002369 [Mucor saturninus]
MTVESTSLESNTATKSAGLDKNLDEMDEQPTASFTGSSLHASIISPIHMSNLPLNILEHIQQHNGNVITSLPNNTISPEVLLHQQSSINHNNSSGADTKKSDEKSKGLTPDERRQRRLLRNRLAAKDCRKKKKEYIKQMEERISQLESERIELKEKVDELKAKIASVPSAEQMMMNNDDNYKLMKEVEALNAKLGNMQ